MSPGDRMGKGLDFMLKGIGPKDKTPVSEGEPQESGVTTLDPGVESQGKGDQLQDPSILNQESRVTTLESGSDVSEEKSENPESGVRLPESGVMTQEARVESQDTSVAHQDPGILSQESGVTTHESGIDSSKEKEMEQESRVGLPESGVANQESGVRIQDQSAQLQEARPQSHEEKDKPRVVTQESGVGTDDVIDQAVTQALKSPKISLYSPLLLAVLESQQLMLLNRREATLLQYRKSTKARELVENALKEAYPELCEKILRRINEGNGKK